VKNKHSNPMKNIFKWAFVALALVGVSCSKSDDNNGGSGSGSGFNSGDFTVGKHFPKKVKNPDTGNFEDLFEISNGKIMKAGSLTYEYEGNLLKKVKDEGGTFQEFFYTNGKLTKRIHAEEGTFEYVYDAQGRISKKYRTFPSGNSTTTEYHYIDANTIKTIYKDRSNSRDLETTYHFSNGNLIREEDSRGTIVYEYDDKNNWMYNNNFIITISSVLGEFFDYDYSKNNVTKIIVRGNRSEDYRYEDATTTFQYEYNSDNYPTKVTQTKDGRVQKITEYQY